MPQRAVVTGAYGYVGAATARALLGRGFQVETLTTATRRAHPLRALVRAHHLDFDRVDELVAILQGADVLVNTWWIRVPGQGLDFHKAVARSGRLIAAAQRAGVRRLVHISVLHPQAHARLPYYAGKAAVEQLVQTSALPFSILRPGIVCGGADVLLNNIAWGLRHGGPVFPLPADGRMHLRPILVDDLGELAAQHAGCRQSQIVDAVGPERFRYRDLVRLIDRRIGTNRRFQAVPPQALGVLGRLAGVVLGDLLLTSEEIAALVDGALDSTAPATGQRRISGWIANHATRLGRHFAGERIRRRERETPYAALRLRKKESSISFFATSIT